MILKHKNAIIYGAGGSVPAAIAKALAGAGARLFLTGRNLANVQKVADDIIASGGSAEAAQVDALDEKAVNGYIKTVVDKAGTVDVSFDAIGLEVVQNMPLVDISVEDFVRPVTIAMRTQFLTTTAAARVMMRTRIRGNFIPHSNPGRNRLSFNSRFRPGMLRHRKFFKEPGFRVRHLRHPGGKYPFRRFAGFKSVSGRH